MPSTVLGFEPLRFAAARIGSSRIPRRRPHRRPCRTLIHAVDQRGRYVGFLRTLVFGLVVLREIRTEDLAGDVDWPG